MIPDFTVSRDAQGGPAGGEAIALVVGAMPLNRIYIFDAPLSFVIKIASDGVFGLSPVFGGMHGGAALRADDRTWSV